MDKRERNIQIFEDTKALCEQNKKLAEAIKNCKQKQKIILESEEIAKQEEAKKEVEAKVIVSKKRTLEAAAAYKGKKVCVHNFASATNPGGGVTKGSSAQEECLCRCSTLYFHLNQPEAMKKFYMPHRNLKSAIYNDDCIYTPEVWVIKEDTQEPKRLPEKDWYQVNVITCAAPNLRSNPSNSMNPGGAAKRTVPKPSELKEIHKKRFKRILDIAKADKNEVLILGAFGCGAFQNPPSVVVQAFAEVLPEYIFDFKVIEFAVYCTPKDMENYNVFERRFGNWKSSR